MHLQVFIDNLLLILERFNQFNMLNWLRLMWMSKCGYFGMDLFQLSLCQKMKHWSTNIVWKYDWFVGSVNQIKTVCHCNLFIFRSCDFPNENDALRNEKKNHSKLGWISRRFKKDWFKDWKGESKLSISFRGYPLKSWKKFPRALVFSSVSCTHGKGAFEKSIIFTTYTLFL